MNRSHEWKAICIKWTSQAVDLCILTARHCEKKSIKGCVGVSWLPCLHTAVLNGTHLRSWRFGFFWSRYVYSKFFFPTIMLLSSPNPMHLLMSSSILCRKQVKVVAIAIQVNHPQKGWPNFAQFNIEVVDYHTKLLDRCDICAFIYYKEILGISNITHEVFIHAWGNCILTSLSVEVELINSPRLSAALIDVWRAM